MNALQCIDTCSTSPSGSFTAWYLQPNTSQTSFPEATTDTPSLHNLPSLVAYHWLSRWSLHCICVYIEGAWGHYSGKGEIWIMTSHVIAWPNHQSSKSLVHLPGVLHFPHIISKEEKRVIEDEMVRWHYQFTGHELGQTPGDGKGPVSLACSSPRSWRIRLGDWATTTKISKEDKIPQPLPLVGITLSKYQAWIYLDSSC